MGLGQVEGSYTACRGRMKAIEACDIASETSSAIWATAFVVIFAVFVFVDMIFSGWVLVKLVRSSEKKI